MSENLSLNDLPDILSVRQVATFYQVQPITIRRWIKQGKITPCPREDPGDGKRGQEIRIPKSEIVEEEDFE